MTGSQSSTRRLVTVLMSAVMVLSVVGMGGAGLAGAQETDTQPTYELQFDGNSDTPYAFGIPGPTDQTFGEFIADTDGGSSQQVDGAAGGSIYELEDGEWNQVTGEDNVVGLQAYVLTGNEDTVQAQAQIAQDDEGQFQTASLALDAGANFVTPTAQGEVADSTTFQISDGDATQVQNPYAEPSISQGSESSFSSTPVSGSTETVNPFAGYFLVSDSGVYTSTINTGNDQAAATEGLNLNPNDAPASADFAVSINADTSTSDVTAGEDAIINATITNNGDLTATQTINFTVNGNNEGSVEVTDLAGGSTEDVEFTYNTELADDGATAEVASDNATASTELAVVESDPVTTTVDITSATFTNGDIQSDSVTILGTVTSAADETLSSITVGFGNIAGNIGLGNVEAGNIEIGNAGAGNVKIGNSGTVAVGNVEVGNTDENLTVTLSEDIALEDVEDDTAVDIRIDDVDTTEADTTSGNVSVSFEDTNGDTITENETAATTEKQE